MKYNNLNDMVKDIEERREIILADERLSYKSASVFTNAPLALIQYRLESELRLLEELLGLEITDINKLRNE